MSSNQGNAVAADDAEVPPKCFQFPYPLPSPSLSLSPLSSCRRCQQYSLKREEIGQSGETRLLCQSSGGTQRDRQSDWCMGESRKDRMNLALRCTTMWLCNRAAAPAATAGIIQLIIVEKCLWCRWRQLIAAENWNTIHTCLHRWRFSGIRTPILVLEVVVLVASCQASDHWVSKSILMM